jgi:hypothetical protein
VFAGALCGACTATLNGGSGVNSTRQRHLETTSVVPLGSEEDSRDQLRRSDQLNS